MIDFAKTLGKADDPALYTRQLECIKEIFSNKYIANDGLMDPNLQNVYVLDFPSAVRRETVKEQLAAYIYARGNHLNTGLSLIFSKREKNVVLD